MDVEQLLHTIMPKLDELSARLKVVEDSQHRQLVEQAVMKETLDAIEETSNANNKVLQGGNGDGLKAVVAGLSQKDKTCPIGQVYETLMGKGNAPGLVSLVMRLEEDRKARADDYRQLKWLIAGTLIVGVLNWLLPL